MADRVYIQTLDIDGYIIGSGIAQALQQGATYGVKVYMDTIQNPSNILH
jgi:hypothetical protein